MQDARRPLGYRQAHASRQQPKLPQRKAPKVPAHQTPKTLLEALQQQPSARLSDGAKLNVVGRAVERIGELPPAVSVPVSTLFLSQNRLTTLHGVEQFAALRVLSAAGNALASFDDVERLAALPRLRALNLLGNPLADLPHYRLRVVDCLPRLQVLDTVDVSARERGLASRVAAQERALRGMLLSNHFTIQKLQRAAMFVQLRRDLAGFVLGYVATGSRALSFDRVPSPQDATVDVALLVRLWDFERMVSREERAALERQMLAIVVRTRSKLAEHPKLRAKEYLLKLASATLTAELSQMPSELRQQCALWDEAYGNVIALQQQTIANLQALCDRHNKELVTHLMTLLTTEPSRRGQIVHAKWRGDCGRLLTDEVVAERGSGIDGRRLSVSSLGRTKRLPPQQQDPEHTDAEEVTRQRRQHPKAAASKPVAQSQQRIVSSHHTPSSSCLSIKPNGRAEVRKQQSASVLKAPELRNGDFGNKTLAEAIHNFKMREPSASSFQPAPPPPPPLPPPPPPSLSRCNDPPLKPHFEHMTRPQVFTMQHKTRMSFQEETQRASSSPRTKSTSTAFVPVSTTHLASISLDDMNESHELAASMNEHAISRHSSGLGASHRASTVEELVETSSSVSGCSNASSFWRERDRLPTKSNRGGHNLNAFHSDQVETRSSERALAPPPASRIDCRAVNDRRIDACSRDDAETKAVFDGEERKTKSNQRSPRPPARSFVTEQRLQELEDREAKYIKALIESEQRELDLRNQLNGYRHKIGRYKQTMAKDFEEREQIKREVNEKVQALAAPKVLRRFFIRWIHHYHWSLQIAHLHRKRCFIMQHNWFWCWRRKAWTQQQLRELRGKQQLRILRDHFAKWTNISRLAVIIVHAERRRRRQIVRRVMQTWRAGAKILAMGRQVEQSRKLEATQILLCHCFRQWAKRCRHQKQLTSAVELHSRQSCRTLQELMFWRWRMMVVTHARPLREQLKRFVVSKQSQYQKQVFRNWRNLVKSSKLYACHLQRRVWRYWSLCSLSTKVKRETALQNRRAQLKVHLQSWNLVTQGRIASRRSLSLAKRYVNRHRLRKLWLYWKRYTIAKRKYVLGSTKALKHYFIKLLRSSWKSWKCRTRKNLMSVREQKRNELKRHFHNLRAGIRLAVADKCRARMFAHLRVRQERALLRRLTVEWRCLTQRRRRGKLLAETVTRLTARNVVQSSWSQWMTHYLVRVRQNLLAAGKRFEDALKEKHDMEADLLIVNDRSVSLNQRIASLEDAMKRQEREIATYQDELVQSEELRAETELKIKALSDAHETERQKWRVFEAQMSEEHEAQNATAQTLVDANTSLQNQVRELQAQILEEQERTAKVSHRCDCARQELEQAKIDHVAEVSRLNGAKSELVERIKELERVLHGEQREKDEIANRLQEYEARLATARADISQHEEEQLRENERLRLERDQIDTKVKEEQARNAELQRMVVEKNEEIRHLVQQQQQQRRDQERSTNKSFAQKVVPQEELRPQVDATEKAEDVGHTLLGETHASYPPYERHLPAHTSVEACADRSAGTGTVDATLHSLLKDINESIRARADCVERSVSPVSHHHHHHRHEYPRARQRASSPPGDDERDHYGECYPPNSAPKVPLATDYTVFNSLAEDTDAHIDEHTNKVHEDIRQLQERIVRRLQQPAASATAESRRSPFVLRSAGHYRERLLSPSSSLASLSDKKDPNTDIEDSRRKSQREEHQCANLHPRLYRTRTSGTSVPISRKSSSNENISRSANTLSKSSSVASKMPVVSTPALRESLKVPAIVAAAAGGKKKKRVKVSSSSSSSRNAKRK